MSLRNIQRLQGDGPGVGGSGSDARKFRVRLPLKGSSASCLNAKTVDVGRKQKPLLRPTVSSSVWSGGLRVGVKLYPLVPCLVGNAEQDASNTERVSRPALPVLSIPRSLSAGGCILEPSDTDSSPRTSLTTTRDRSILSLCAMLFVFYCAYSHSSEVA